MSVKPKKIKLKLTFVFFCIPGIRTQKRLTKTTKMLYCFYEVSVQIKYDHTKVWRV